MSFEELTLKSLKKFDCEPHVEYDGMCIKRSAWQWESVVWWRVCVALWGLPAVQHNNSFLLIISQSSVSAAVSSDLWAPADNIKTLFSDNSPHQLQDQWLKYEDECSWLRQDSSSVTSKLTKKRITKQSVRLRIFPWKGYIKHYSEPQDQSWRNLGWEHRPYSCN